MAEKRDRTTEENIELEAEAACLETEGVACMTLLTYDMIAESILRKNQSRGIKLSKNGDGYNIDVYAEVYFGCRIPETAWNIQENVKQRVEANTSAKVNKVNIHIEGVRPQEEKTNAQN